MKSIVDDQISAWREAMGAASDAELARMLGYNPSTITQWRNRGTVPKSAQKKFEALEKYGVQARAMEDRRRELGSQVMYEGLCLAIWLAPSLDAYGRRFGPMDYTGTLRDFASLFSEIEVACAEEVAARRITVGGNATDAFESLAKDEPSALLKRVRERALWWRYGDTSSVATA